MLNPTVIARLNINLSDVDTSIPVLEANDYLVEIGQATASQMKDSDDWMVVVPLTLLSDAQSTSGAIVKAGFKLRYTIMLYADPEHANAEYAKQNMAGLVDAAFKIERKEDRPPFSEEVLNQMVGLQVIASVEPKQSKNGTEIFNNVKRLTAKP